MRWRDEFIGLLAVTLLFGMVVLRAQGVGWTALVPVLALALVLLFVMALRTRMTPKILIVGGRAEGRRYSLEEELDDAGFGLRSCPGPAHRPCPVVPGPLPAVCFASDPRSFPCRGGVAGGAALQEPRHEVLHGLRAPSRPDFLAPLSVEVLL